MSAHLIASYKTIEMNGDGSCFYHCVDHCLNGRADYTRVLNTSKLAMNKLFQKLTIEKNLDMDAIFESTPSDNARVLRYMVSVATTQDDFERYQMLCIAEEDNPAYETVECFRTGILFSQDYANEVIINILLRTLNKELSDQLGIYIIKNQTEIHSQSDWLNKSINMFIEFVDDIHYNVLHIENSSALVPKDKLEKILFCSNYKS